MRCQQLGVAGVADPFQEGGAALDVAEQERDGPAPGDPPGSEAETPREPQATGEPSGGPASSMDPEASNGSVGPSASESALPEDDDDGSSGGGGVGRLGWIVLGGMTSAAGAFVLVRQWRARPRG